eukprot:GFYU01015424.1.p1 GENE.GFYU01015424.1~~GFYU01015424.1.p1  ORF type:complete len:267 (+),score=76.86 GFYU01015424.1:27-803(+)
MSRPLVVGQTEHRVLYGIRVSCTPEESVAMGAKNADERPINQCIMCGRKDMSEGDFAYEHILMMEKDDPKKEVKSVRTLPRMFCYPCSKEHAEADGKTRIVPKTKPVRPVSEVWEEKALMMKENMQKEVEEMRAASYAGLSKSQKKNKKRREKEQAELLATVFLTVETVHEGSPAEECGLVAADQIVKFGDVTKAEFKGDIVESIVPILQSNIDKTVTVTVLRSCKDNPEILKPTDMNLTPKKWSGGGLLGCVLVPRK